MKAAAGGNPSVVILEPDALQRDLLDMVLTRAGFSVKVCPAVEDLDGLLADLNPVFLLLDIRLGSLNGIDLLERLKTDGLLGRTRAIMLSSLAFPEVVLKATKAGAVDFLIKPIDTELLIDRLLRAAAH